MVHSSELKLGRYDSRALCHLIAMYIVERMILIVYVSRDK